MSQIFVVSGIWGSGKSETSLSFTPPGNTSTPRRITVDPELRTSTYQSKDGADHPNLHQYGFEVINQGSRLTGPIFFGLMKATAERNWGEKGVPAVIIIDDTAMLQGIMQTWWSSNIENAKMTAALYNKQGERALLQWKPRDPGTINFFKSLFEEWMLDLKAQNIFLILTSPQHNIWENYGSTARDDNGKPLMRIKGKSAMVWDCWQKMCDVIWVLSRNTPTGLAMVPNVSMDLFIPKASLPGLPEQFTWPGWAKVWEWHETRAYVADISKLTIPEPTLDPESLAAAIKNGKVRLVKELEGVTTVEQIREILADDFAPTYDLDNHDEVKAYILRIVDERKKKAGAEKSAKTPAPAKTE